MERLEGRRFLSASPFAGPHGPEFHVPALEAAAFDFIVAPPVLSAEIGHAGRAVVIAENELPVRPVLLAEAAMSQPTRWENSLLLAPQAARFAAFDNASPLPLPTNPLMPPRVMTVGLPSVENPTDESAARFLVWMLGNLPDMGFDPAASSFATDDHLRAVQFARDSFFEVSLAGLVPDSARASMNHAGQDMGTLESSRHPNPNSPAGMGQTVEWERGLEPARLMFGKVASTTNNQDGLNGSPPETVSHLVAAGSQALLSPMAMGARDELFVDERLTTSAWHDLLLPRFPCDVASLGAALADLVFEADEWGAGLLSLLTEVPREGELALLAGLVGAGAAYRYVREGQRRELAEKQEVLRSRFIGAPATIRLRRATAA